MAKMTNSGAKMIAVIAVVAILAVTGVFMYMSGGAQNNIISPPSGGGTGGKVTDWRVVCGDDGLGAVPLGVQNMQDKAATTYLVTTARMYLVSNGVEQFYQTQALGNSGLTTVSSLPCGQTFRVYAAAGSNISAYKDFTVTKELNDPVVINSATWGNLIFRVYDDDNRGYVYSNDSTPDSVDAAGTWRNTSSYTGMQNKWTFYSTTSNTSGPTIGTDGYIRSTIEFETNGTLSSSNRFTDKSLLACLDAQDMSDWQAPSSIKVAGYTVASAAKPDKVSNDGYDYCWEVTDGGNVPVIGASPVALSYEIHAKSGVNPSDDLQWVFLTKGYYRKTLSEDMGNDYYKDDSSQTYVYTQTQYLVQNVD